MTLQLTIIGLGRIGASVGLALAGRKETLLRVGHDIAIQTARQAEKIGAVDRTMINLPASVRDANIVLLALPLDQIRETLEIIAPDLQENSVVMDTAPVKSAVMAWAKELLPENRYYVGLTPAVNPAYFRSAETGIAAARSDLFQKGLFAILTPPGAPADVVKLATDFTVLLGAQHLYADPLEADGLMAAAHLLPQLLSAALLNATTSQPGWREGRKLAGGAYASVSGPLAELEGPESLSAAVMHSRDNALRAVDNAITELEAIRSSIQAENAEVLSACLKTAAQNQRKWLEERQASNWAADVSPSAKLPTMADALSGYLGFLGKKRKT